mgnify:CR=1 FL=1
MSTPVNLEAIDDKDELRELLGDWRQAGEHVALVPTMGNLHDGHLSLLEVALKENSFAVLSIFVNPTQFLPGEDLDAYPRKEEADKKICEMCKVDYLFMPEGSTMYQGDDEVLIKALLSLLGGLLIQHKSRYAF